MSGSATREKPRPAQTPLKNVAGCSVSTVHEAVADAPAPPLVVQRLPSQKLAPPQRPGYGKAGRKCQVYTNHFHVDPVKDLYVYQVKITPIEYVNNTKVKIIKSLLNDYKSVFETSKLVYDASKDLATAVECLPVSGNNFVVKINESGLKREFQVRLEPPKCESKDQKHIDAVQTVIRVGAIGNGTRDRNCIFSPDLGKGSLGGGINYEIGYFQTVRPTQLGLSINLDVTARALSELGTGPVVEFVKKILNKDVPRHTSLSEEEWFEVEGALRRKKVKVHGVTYTWCHMVQGLTAQPLVHLTLRSKDRTGATKSVTQYYYDKYNIKLRFAFLPALQVGTEAKPIYLPMELCYFAADQKHGTNLNNDQRLNLCKAARHRPKERQTLIQNAMKFNAFKKHELVAEDFGLKVAEEMTLAKARVLIPPTLTYRGSRKVTPKAGQWSIQHERLFDPGNLKSWAIVDFARRPETEVKEFFHRLVRVCNDKGLGMNNEPFTLVGRPPNQVEATLRLIDSMLDVDEDKPRNHMVFVILPWKDKDIIHSQIKRVCETDLGLLSQCIQANNLRKRGDKFLEHIAMKINLKVGGRNSVLSAALDGSLFPYQAKGPTIVFGADVIHPPTGDTYSPSISAVVASMDWPGVTTYRSVISSQSHRSEIIKDLYQAGKDSKGAPSHGGSIRELLLAFFDSTGQQPEHILFYRDGVSENQFDEVMKTEIEQIRKACSSLEKDYEPRITFVIVQKRHHTRLFPTRTTNLGGNILPGTVVDTDVCHPRDFDFYLCSHANDLGTSHPAHYHVLHDDNKFSADGLQQLTNSLCHTFSKCTKSVSVVPAVLYADLAALRGQKLMEVGGLSLPEIHKSVKEFMFYC